MIDALWHDTRYALRLIRLNPAFAVVAIVSIALAAGANTAIFAGTILSLIAGRSAATFLFGVKPNDPLTLAMAGIAIALWRLQPAIYRRAGLRP